VLAPGEHYPFIAYVRRRQGTSIRIIPGTVQVRNTLTGEEYICALDTILSENPMFVVTAPANAEEGEYALEYRLVNGPHENDIVSRHHFSVGHIDRSRQIREVYRAKTKYRFELLHGTVSGELYCRDGDGVLLLSRDKGSTWHNILPPAHAEKSIHQIAGDTRTSLFAVTSNYQLLTSDDGGASWKKEHRLGDEVHRVASRGKYALALADGEIFYSVDTGRTWTCVTPFEGSLYFDLHLLNNGDPLVSYERGLVYSRNGGNHWLSIRTPLGRNRIRQFLATSDGALLIPTGHVLYRSTDMGESWSYEINRRIQLGYLRDLVETGDGMLFARYNKANPVVRRLQDGTWENDLAVPDSLQYDVELIRSVGNTIAVATRDRLYIRPAEEIMAVRRGQPPRSFRIASASPNPLSTTARITVENETEQVLQLRIHDLLGRCRLTLHDGWLPAGRRTFRLDGSRLPAGSYLLMLRNGSTVQTRNLTVVH